MLGCGCGGLILLALLVFGAVRYVTKHSAEYRADTDTTQVSTKPTSDESSDTTQVSTEPSSDESSDTTSTGKPTDDASSSDGDEGLKEIRPVPADSTF